MNPCLDPGERDAGDADSGDYDPTEVSSHVINAWHPSHVPSAIPQLPTGRTAIGCNALCTAKLLITPRRHTKAPRTAQSCGGWRDTPESFRRLVARSAGLELAVVDKLDRELSEAEKAAIRLAARRLRDRADALFAL